MKKSLKYKKGFTLIELLTVISIISLMASVVLSNVNSAREKGRMAAGMQFEANILHGIGDQLVGEWRFNDGAGLALDTSSFNYNGTVSGATWIANGGYDGKGVYSFNGSNNYIQTTMPLSLVNKNNWAITAWVTGDSPTAGWGWIVGESVIPYFLIGKQAGANALHINIVGCGTYNSISDTAIFDGVYHHVAVVNTNGVLQVYVDAKLKASLGTSCIPTATSNMRIGTRSIGEYWNGKIDNVRVYTSSLTSMNIQNIYAQEKDKYADSLAIK